MINGKLKKEILNNKLRNFFSSYVSFFLKARKFFFSKTNIQFYYVSLNNWEPWNDRQWQIQIAPVRLLVKLSSNPCLCTGNYYYKTIYFTTESCDKFYLQQTSPSLSEHGTNDVQTKIWNKTINILPVVCCVTPCHVRWTFPDP